MACLWRGVRICMRSGGRLPEVGKRLLSTYSSCTLNWVRILRSIVLLAWIWRSVWTACELSLKMKEMTITHSEPFHFMEFRHGPMSMVNDHTVVVGLLSASITCTKQKCSRKWKLLGQQVSLGEAGADVSFELTLPNR